MDMSKQNLISSARAMAERKLVMMKDDGEPLESFLYLLHHVHVDEDGDEELHHCFVLDHLGNKFTTGHIKGTDGVIYHAITGLEDDQEVFWSDEEAEAAGCPPPCPDRQLQESV